MSEKNGTMDIEQIKKLIPHRYPFLFLDKVIEFRDKGLTAIKNVTGNEAYFQGHFPDYPVMPGVLQLECLAQAAALFEIVKHKLENKPIYFMALDKVKFRSIVVPGDVLTIVVESLRFGGRISKCKGTASVGDRLVVEAEMTAMLAPE
jgi:3-hydroxyacyl-[acyl-carrier-protein] dehydratase